ncbi:MAG: hypothetical protein ACE5GK_08795 [Nitrospiria bacterium]
MWNETIDKETACRRCGGRMSCEWFAGKAELIGCWHYKGWRCVCCGEIIDTQILINRVKASGLKEDSRPLPVNRFYLLKYFGEMANKNGIANYRF